MKIGWTSLEQMGMMDYTMGKRLKKFIVFNHDPEIYIYDPEVDDRLLATNKAKLFESLKDAKKAAKENLTAFYISKELFIDQLEYKDF